VYSLGAGDTVVAITNFTKYPAAAETKPSVGGITNPSIEAIIALHPDLVFALGQLSPNDVARRLETLGVAIFFVLPRGIRGIYSSIESLGRALNRTPAANELVARLQRREMAVRARVAGQPVPRIFFPVWLEPVITAGRNAFITELIAAAGGKSITDDLAQDWPQISLETVVARQPEGLLLIRESQLTIADLKTKAVWKDLKCVQQGKVFYVDDRINSPSPVAFDALEELANQFHPQGSH